MVSVSELEINNYVASRVESLGLRLHKAILRKSWSHLDSFLPCFGLKQLCLILMLALNFMSCLGVCLKLCTLDCTEGSQVMKCYRPHDRICLLIYCSH